MTPNERPSRPRARARRRRVVGALCSLALSLTALVGATGAGAYVTPEQAAEAAARGAAWFESTQAGDGALGSDWGLTALAAAGTSAADVRTALAAPSAQDFYVEEWRASGPGGAATDAERGILAAVAGGIQASRLSASADATRSNLVARLAELYDGTQIGSPGLLNDDVFGVLALREVGAPPALLRRLVDHLRERQLVNGGWSWSASFGVADTDVTGAAVAAFCAAGLPSDDPDLAEALAYLDAQQDVDSGGFAAPPPFGVGVNTNTTGWVLSGLIQCGIDPQGPRWTTSAGKTPLDYLLSMQEEDGGFRWTAEYGGGPMQTADSVRPLAGVAFTSPAPVPEGGGDPLRPAAPVAPGTTVPIALAIDHGPGADEARICRVDVADGSDLAEVLEAARESATPAGCVGEFTVAREGDGVAVEALNGVAAGAGHGWTVRVDGGAAARASGEPIGFGDLVVLRFGATLPDAGPAPEVTVAPLQPRARPAAGPLARVAIAGRPRLRGERLLVPLRCPRGLGAEPCRGLLRVLYRPRPNGRPRGGGSAAFELTSGSRAEVSVSPSAGLRERLRRGGRLGLRLAAATRAADGSVRLTRALRFLAR